MGEERNKKIEKLKNKDVFIKRYFKKCDEIKYQNKIIDLMSEQLAGLTIWNAEKDEPIILNDKEEVIKYFKKKAEMQEDD